MFISVVELLFYVICSIEFYWWQINFKPFVYLFKHNTDISFELCRIGVSDSYTGVICEENWFRFIVYNVG